MEEQKLSLIKKLRRFFFESIRVLKVTKKPSKEEFKTIVKASAIGLSIIGLLGFAINMFRQLLVG